MQIHFLGLQSPFRTVAHSPQPPKKQYEKENHCNSEDREQSFFAKRFFQITKSGRRDMNHFVAAAPEKQSRDQHGDSGNSKRPTWAPLRIREQPRAKNRRDKRAGVDGEIEPAEHFR